MVIDLGGKMETNKKNEMKLNDFANTFIVSNKDRQGTCYHEFYLGRWKLGINEHWNNNSIFIHDNNFDVYMYIFLKHLRKYDRYSVKVVDRKEYNEVSHCFNKMLTLLSSEKNVLDCLLSMEVGKLIEKKFYEQIQKIDKNTLIRTIKILIEWMNNAIAEYDNFTILGI